MSVAKWQTFYSSLNGLDVTYTPPWNWETRVYVYLLPYGARYRALMFKPNIFVTTSHKVIQASHVSCVK